MTANNKMRARDRVYRAVAERLMFGAHRPGEKIKIRPLAEVLGTSTTPVREALLQLVVAGALKHDPQHSIRVPSLNAEEYSELIHLRTLIECDLAGVAASCITSEELGQLEGMALSLQGNENHISGVANFHFALYRAARMSQAIPLIESLWLRTGPYLHVFEKVEDAPWGVRLRGEILRGLRARDAELVRSSLAEDLACARAMVLENMAKDQKAMANARRKKRAAV